MGPTSFLSLPAELRNEIYALVFCEPPTPLTYPWTDGRSCTTVIPLFQTCRQVYSEASSLLWKCYIQNLCLHFDSAADFEHFVQDYLPNNPHFNDVSFRLRVTAPDYYPSASDLRTIRKLLPEDFNREWDPISHHPPPDEELWEIIQGLNQTRFYDPTALAKGRRRTIYTYRHCTADSPYRVASNGLKWTVFGWNDWLKDGEFALRRRCLELRGASQAPIAQMGLNASLGRKVRSTSVVIEGRFHHLRVEPLRIT